MAAAVVDLSALPVRAANGDVRLLTDAASHIDSVRAPISMYEIYSESTIVQSQICATAQRMHVHWHYHVACCTAQGHAH
jgi:hypothetical protein